MELKTTQLYLFFLENSYKPIPKLSKLLSIITVATEDALVSQNPEM